MLLFATAIIATVSNATAGDQASTRPVVPVCQLIERQAVAKSAERGAHKLAQEPPAKDIAAVLYTEGGCAKPIVIREQLGSPPKR